MASPMEMLGEMAAQIGDLPEKLVSALKAAQSPAPMALETGGQRVPLPMAGEQSQPRQQQPTPTSFPMPQPTPLPSSLPAPQASQMPQGIPAQAQPSISPVTVPAGQAMPSGLPSASMPSPTSPSAGLFGMPSMMGNANSEDRNDKRMVELLEDISDKLDELIATQRVTQGREVEQNPGKPEHPHAPEPPTTYQQSNPSSGRSLNFKEIFRRMRG